MIWGMFMAVTMESATFMVKNFQNKQNSIMNTSDLTLKKMFDISAKLVSEQDEIFKVDTIPWEQHSWEYLSLIGDETIINLQRAKVYVFSDYVLCLGRLHQYPKSNEAWKDRIGWITTDQSYRDYDGINGEPTEFEWNIFQDSPRCSSMVNVKGMYPAPDIHEHFTMHKWLRQTAYIFTHNFNNLEHIANNCMSAMTHTDVTTAHH